MYFKYVDGLYEKVLYFCLFVKDLMDVIVLLCYLCFDYVNGFVDVVVGYMGVSYMDKLMD